MKILKAHPPNIHEIDRKFHVKDRHGILYTYGDIIYNPSGGYIPQYLISHEEVHSQRQYELGLLYNEGQDDPQCHEIGAKWWWKKYIESDEYRLEEELLAHQIEYQVFKLTHNRHETRGHLVEMAERLSGSMYGNCISKKEAKRLIRVETPQEPSVEPEVTASPEENL